MIVLTYAIRNFFQENVKGSTLTIINTLIVIIFIIFTNSVLCEQCSNAIESKLNPNHLW